MQGGPWILCRGSIDTPPESKYANRVEHIFLHLRLCNLIVPGHCKNLHYDIVSEYVQYMYMQFITDIHDYIAFIYCCM